MLFVLSASCHDVLRSRSEQGDAENPELLRSSALIKHAATMPHILNSSDNQRDVLAEYIEQDVKVHID